MIIALRTILLLSFSLLAAACAELFPMAEGDRSERLQASLSQCLEGQDRIDQHLTQQDAKLDHQQLQLEAQAATLLQLKSRKPPVAVQLASPGGLECLPQAVKPSKLTVGKLELVWLQELSLALPARIDTGAETASLSARNVQEFERDGRRWVRFEVPDPKTGDALPLERRLVRSALVRQASNQQSERRAVVRLGIVIGPFSQNAEFTLSDRSHLDHPLLIGRNVLQDLMLVDVSEQNIAPYVLPDDEQVQH